MKRKYIDFGTEFETFDGLYVVDDWNDHLAFCTLKKWNE